MVFFLLDIVFQYKEFLFYIPFSIDILLCCIQFPLFVTKGSEWFATTLAEGTTSKDGDGSKEKPPKKVTTYVFQRLYDVFLLCYSGYCLMMFYGCYTIIVYKKDLLPIFGTIQFCINLMKLWLMSRWNTTDENENGNVELQSKKDNSLKYFNVPTYGGYCFLCFLEKMLL